MSQDLATTAYQIESDTLHEVHRRLVEIHYRLSEASGPERELRQETLAGLMDTLRFIETSSRPTARTDALEATARAARRARRELDVALSALSEAGG